MRHAAVAQDDLDDRIREGDVGNLAGVDGLEKLRESQCRWSGGPSGEVEAANHAQEECGGDEHRAGSPKTRELQQNVRFAKNSPAREGTRASLADCATELV